MAAEEDHALPDTHNADPQTRPSQMSSQETPATTKEKPGIQHQEEEEPRPPQQASPTRSRHRSPPSLHRRKPDSFTFNINTLVILPKVYQKPELWAQVMQNRTAIFRQFSKKMFTGRVVALPHSRHNRPVYTINTAKANKPETVEIMFTVSGQK
jgi:hypothetical protein